MFATQKVANIPLCVIQPFTTKIDICVWMLKKSPNCVIGEASAMRGLLTCDLGWVEMRSHAKSKHGIGDVCGFLDLDSWNPKVSTAVLDCGSKAVIGGAKNNYHPEPLNTKTELEKASASLTMNELVCSY